MPPQDLERSVNYYCGTVSNQVIRRYRCPKVRDYPATVVSCRMNNGNRQIYKAESKKPTARTYAPILLDALNKLGAIGQHSNNGCPYLIGNCAEPHAANKLLKKNCSDLKQIVFSTARRPRTGQIIPYCANCLTIFKNL